MALSDEIEKLNIVAILPLNRLLFCPFPLRKSPFSACNNILKSIMHKRYFNIQSLLSNINQWIEISSKSIFTQRYFFSNENLLFEKECKQKSAVKGCIRITVLDAGAFVYLLMQSRVVPDNLEFQLRH